MKVSFSMFFNSRCKTLTSHVTKAAQLSRAMSMPASNLFNNICVTLIMYHFDVKRGNVQKPLLCLISFKISAKLVKLC